MGFNLFALTHPRPLLKSRCVVMQGLALYSGTGSFMHKLNTDSVSSFELTAINTNTLSTGIY